MRRIEFLIADIRQGTNNTEYSTTEGIPQNEFVRHLKDAQRHLQNLIIQQHQTAFIKEKYIDIVSGQELYAAPSDAHLGQNIISMEFSPSAAQSAFRKVELGTRKERNTAPGYPQIYIPQDGNFLLNPIPQASIAQGLRIGYQYRVPDLDMRRASVASAVVNSGTKQVTSITVNNNATLDPNGFAAQDYITVVDKDGNILMNSIAVSAWDPVGLVITGDPSFVYQTGETIPTGSYICFGKNTTTHSSMMDLCEDYLMKSCEYMILKRDSNVDSAESLADLRNKEKAIIDAYASLSQDYEGIPITNHEFGFGGD